MIALDWVAVSSIGTAGATLVLAVATFASVRSATPGLPRSRATGTSTGPTRAERVETVTL